MSTKPPVPGELDGLAAQLAGIPLDPDPQGGLQAGFYGETYGGANAQPTGAQPLDPNAGPVLSKPDPEVFKHIDGLVRRQEILAKNRLAQDEFYTMVVSGYPWATLTHDTQKDVYEFTLPYGVSSVSIQAVPNKNLDLVNKAAASVLADFPEPDSEPIDDSEEAEEAADFADRFLSWSAGEMGTNDAVLFEDRVKRALVASASFIECWVDPTGGGYTPLQIKAHPLAESPENPLIGPDGMPTTDPVLRYVTAPQGGQFTDDPSQAAPQWQPAIVTSKWGREHIRVFPEDKPVAQAQRIIVLGYCTVSEGRRRWPDTVGQMSPDDTNALCDWTPIRFYALLPAFQRARWKLTDGREKERAGSSDERLFFWYCDYEKAQPDYPKGAHVVVSGAKGGTVLHRDVLSTPVSVTKQGKETSEIRCREIPVVDIVPRLDPNGRDPMGVSYMEQFVGATEFNASLAAGFGENIDKTNHTPFASTATSPIDGDQMANARATEDMLVVNSKEDFPQQLTPPVLPNSFFNMFDLSNDAINSIANQEANFQGQKQTTDESGKAIQLRLGRSQVGNAPMQLSVNNSIARFRRIKLELAMAYYETPQMIQFVGEDGAYKQNEFTGMDFALVGRVGTKAGTGTGMPPDQKVQYVGQLVANKMMTEDEAKEAARPTFSKLLGLAPDPHEQYVERCLATWREGPPSPEWEQEYSVWQQAQVQFEQQQQQYQQAIQAFNQWVQFKAVAAGGPPPITLGPEGQNAKAMQDYQMAVEQLQLAPMQLPRILQFDMTGNAIPPQAPQPPQVQKPWSPFAPRPNDTEPAISSIWLRKMSRGMSGSEFSKFQESFPGWTDDYVRQYMHVRQAAAVGSAGMQPPSQPIAAPRRQAATPKEATHQPQSPEKPHSQAA